MKEKKKEKCPRTSPAARRAIITVASARQASLLFSSPWKPAPYLHPGKSQAAASAESGWLAGCCRCCSLARLHARANRDGHLNYLEDSSRSSSRQQSANRKHGKAIRRWPRENPRPEELAAAAVARARRALSR